MPVAVFVLEIAILIEDHHNTFAFQISMTCDTLYLGGMPADGCGLHHMTFHDLHSLSNAKIFYYIPYVCFDLIVDHFSSVLRRKHDGYLHIHFV